MIAVSKDSLKGRHNSMYLWLERRKWQHGPKIVVINVVIEVVLMAVIRAVMGIVWTAKVGIGTAMIIVIMHNRNTN